MASSAEIYCTSGDAAGRGGCRDVDMEGSSASDLSRQNEGNLLFFYSENVYYSQYKEL